MCDGCSTQGDAGIMISRNVVARAGGPLTHASMCERANGVGSQDRFGATSRRIILKFREENEGDCHTTASVRLSPDGVLLRTPKA